MHVTREQGRAFVQALVGSDSTNEQRDECGAMYGGWKPSIFMPRRFSRILLELIAVRLDWLQDIKERDAESEGFDCVPVLGNVAGLTASGAFAKKWDGLNADRGYSWASNPFVWALNFKVVESPSA